MNWIEGPSKREKGKEWSGNKLVKAPRRELDLGTKVDDVREIIPDDLFS